MNAEIETRILEASADIADGPYDVDRHEQQIAVGSAWGVVTMFPKGETSIEIHGLDKEQAAAVLRALTPGWRVTNDPPMNTEGWDAPPEGGLSPTRARASYEQHVGRLKRDR